MKNVIEESLAILANKVYIIITIIIAICSYGFVITQPIIGIDDSAIERYFVEGIGPTMGRFGFYLLNKLLPMAEYTPFIVDFLGVVLIIIGATCWCAVWERILEYRLSMPVKIIFTTVMISAPMISEVFIYYLHNGIGICYILSALVMIYYLQAIESSGYTRWINYAKSLLVLWICNSFYEAFVIVFLMAIAMMFFLQVVILKKLIRLSIIIKRFFAAIGLIGVSIILRTLAIEVVIIIFRLENQIGIMNRRSIFEVLAWFTKDDGLAEFVMTLKKYIAMYYVNAIAYVPVRIYMIAVVTIVIISIYYCFKYKRVTPIILVILMQLIPLLLLLLKVMQRFIEIVNFYLFM